MAQLNPNSIFQSWIFNVEDAKVAPILSLLQTQHIQNQIAQTAAEKTLLKFTPDDVQTFLQREAELQGQLMALQYLITLSEEAEKLYDPGASQIVIQSPDQN